MSALFILCSSIRDGFSYLDLGGGGGGAKNFGGGGGKKIRA